MYDLLYIDPPWTFKQYADHDSGRNVRNKYDLLTLADIAGLRISSVASGDSAILCWTSSPFLEETLYCLKSWGFVYRTVAFTWVKLNRNANLRRGTNSVLTPNDFFTGLGFYTRKNAEFCLLATRGSGLKRYRNDVPELVIYPVQKHSKKPDIFRTHILNLFGWGNNIRRVEIFARPVDYLEMPPGQFLPPSQSSLVKDYFDLVGNEIDGTDVRDWVARYRTRSVDIVKNLYSRR